MPTGPVLLIIYFGVVIIAVAVLGTIVVLLLKSFRSPTHKQVPPSVVPARTPALVAPPPNQPLLSDAPVASVQTEKQPARIKSHRLLSPAETEFYNYLKRVTQGRFIIAVKTPLKDVFKYDGWLEPELYSMFANGHVDFLVLHPRSAEPILAIELDDSTHITAAAKDRDARKDRLFSGAKLPLKRVKAGKVWGDAEKNLILDLLKQETVE